MFYKFTKRNTVPVLALALFSFILFSCEDYLSIDGGVASPFTDRGMWFRGDLHMHTTHSDGDSSVGTVIARAEEKGLHFIAITDHDNHMFGIDDYKNTVPAHWTDPEFYSEETVLLYGLEWTSGKGHANVWSDSRFDCQDLWRANDRSWSDEHEPDAEVAAANAHEHGALFSVNHPAAPSCEWKMDVPENTDSIEIWNSMYALPNFNFWTTGIFWDRLLRNGKRLTGIGGSDTHQLNGYQTLAFDLGNPTTWVLAPECTASSILEAIQKGRVTISCAPDAGFAELGIDRNADNKWDVLMGENLVPTSTEKVRLVLHINDLDGDLGTRKTQEVNVETIKSMFESKKDAGAIFNALNGAVRIAVLYKNGILHRVWIMKEGADMLVVDVAVKPGERTYYRFEVLGNPGVFPLLRLLYGSMMYVTNPVYVNY